MPTMNVTWGCRCQNSPQRTPLTKGMLSEECFTISYTHSVISGLPAFSLPLYMSKLFLTRINTRKLSGQSYLGPLKGDLK